MSFFHRISGGLETYENEVYRADICRIAIAVDVVQMEVTFVALDRQARGLDCLVVTTHEEVDVAARPGQYRAIEPTHRTSTDYCNSHESRVPQKKGADNRRRLPAGYLHHWQGRS